MKTEEGLEKILCATYEKYGYLPFKMNKFEEYDLYAQNKDFLVSDRIVTFTDTDGKLMALKPDVTLSIVKNAPLKEGYKQKVSYTENVYRVSESTNQFKEIMQTGLECVGDVGLYDVYEVVFLAAKSLSLISNRFALDIADMGLFSAVLDEAGVDEKLKKKLSKLIAEKNKHDARLLCEENGLSNADADKICSFIDTYGDTASVVEKLKAICSSQKALKAIERLETLSTLLKGTEFSSKIRFDFSVVSSATYYNGIVFKGFVQGVPESVLSGGQYDRLLKKMGKKGGAIGFALYLDLLENLKKENRAYDVDVLVLYDKNTPVEEVVKTVGSLVQAGESVSAQQTDKEIRYQRLVDLRVRGDEKND